MLQGASALCQSCRAAHRLLSFFPSFLRGWFGFDLVTAVDVVFLERRSSSGAIFKITLKMQASECMYSLMGMYC